MPQSSDSGFFEELRRRNVFRVGVAYLVSAWVIAQVADLILDSIESPDWIMQSILVVLGIGFCLALIFAWAYELTSEGIKREHDVDRSQSITPDTGRKLNLIIIGILCIAIVLLVTERIGVFGKLSESEATVSGQKTFVAVLPFANRSADASDQYFVDGIHDDVLTHLSKVHALKVMSRTSVERFRDTKLSIKEIGATLGADAIIEGAVQRSGDRVRITVQLIEAKTDEHIWAEAYDRELSASNIFSIQSEIAIAIAVQLKARLTDEEQTELSATPTESFAAYDLYLQGAVLTREWNPESLDLAADLFRRALDIDPEYARAYAGLCQVFLSNYLYSNNTSMVPRAESYCERALKIDDSLFEVRMSLGNLHLATGELDEAEQQFLLAIEVEPESDWAYRRLARTYLDMSQEGLAEETAFHAIELSPLDPENHDALANVYYKSGQYIKSIAAYEESIRLNPDDASTWDSLGAARYLSGDFAGTESAWRKSLALNGNQSILLQNMGTAFFFERRFEDALDMYKRAAELSPDDQLIWGAIGDASRFIEGKEAESLAAYQTAIELAEKSYRVNSNDIDVISGLARFYATTNQPARAKEFMEIALSIGSDNVYMWYDRSLAFLALGDADAAIVAVEQLVARGYSTDLLASDVMFSDISTDPRFRVITEPKK